MVLDWFFVILIAFGSLGKIVASNYLSSKLCYSLNENVLKFRKY